jgi:hypothetical protein
MLSGHVSYFSRRGLSVLPKQQKWPYIERPAITNALTEAICSPSPQVSWLVGGEGSGKSTAIERALQVINQSRKCPERKIFVIDFAEIRSVTIEGDMYDEIFKMIIDQLSSQYSASAIYGMLLASMPGFGQRVSELASSKPLWSHFLTKVTTTEELWMKLISTSTVSEILSLVLSSDDRAEDDLIRLVGVFDNNTIIFLHLEKIEKFKIKSIFKIFSKFNKLVECNDSLKSIWNITSIPDINLIEISDLPIEAVNSVFIPNLLNDEVHTDSIYSITGGRMGLLERLVAPLNVMVEEKRLADMKQEHQYKSGKENRPSAESKALAMDPLIHKKDVMIMNSIMEKNSYLKESEEFQEKMDKIMEKFDHKIENKLILLETIQLIVNNLKNSKYLIIPSHLSPLDINHPVVTSLLEENIVMVNWLPYPRLVIENPIYLLLLDSFVSGELEALSLADRARYNLVLMKNKTHIAKQLEKLKK